MKNVKRILAMVLALVMCLGLLAACGDKPKETTPAGSDPAAQSTEAPAPKTYKKKIVVGIGNPMTEQDPHLLYDNAHAILINLAYNQLVSYNFEKRELEPELAVEWEARDAQTYYFKLRQGVKFSNGEEMTAEDVRYSFMDRVEVTGGAAQAATFGRIEDVEIVSPYEVIFHLNSGDADFLTRVYQQTFAIFSKKALEADPDNGFKVGTGGWKLVEFVPSDHATYQRVDSSWVWEQAGMVNPTEELEIRYMPESSTRTAALEAKQIAANPNIGMEEYDVVSQNKDLEVQLLPAEVLDYLIINMDNGVAAKDDNLRLAIAYALDINEANTFSQNGLATRAYTMWGASQYGYFDDFGDKKLEHNLDKAKEYMAKSNHPEGVDFKLYVTNNYEPMAQLLQGQLKKIGVNVIVKTTDKAGMTEVVKTGEHDGIYMSITLQAIGDRFHFIPNPKSSTNRARFDHPEMLKMFDDALVEVNDATRKEIYKNIQIMINDIKPDIPFFYEVLVLGNCKGVEGIKWLPDNKSDFTHIRWAEN